MAAVPIELRSVCHRYRRAFDEHRRCRQCASALRVVGVVKEQSVLPAQVLNARQYASHILPTSCPKCGAPPGAWAVDPVVPGRFSCVSCGRDHYLLGDRALMSPRTTHAHERNAR